MSPRYPIFMCRADRDDYLNKLIANCYQVEPITVTARDSTLYSVADAIQKRGK